jgi:hypothetical protein
MCFKQRSACQCQQGKKNKSGYMHNGMELPVDQPCTKFFGTETQAIKKENDRHRPGRYLRQRNRTGSHPWIRPQIGQTDHGKQCKQKSVQSSPFCSFKNSVHHIFSVPLMRICALLFSFSFLQKKFKCSSNKTLSHDLPIRLQTTLPTAQVE